MRSATLPYPNKHVALAHGPRGEECDLKNLCKTLAMCAKAMASKSKLHLMFSQTKVLASNRQTTDGMPGHQKLHHGRLSRRKKLCRVVIIENVVREGAGGTKGAKR